MEGAVGEGVSIGWLNLHGPMREEIMVPWGLGNAGKPPNVGVVEEEIEAVLCTVLGAEAPAAGSMRLVSSVSRQRAGALAVIAVVVDQARGAGVQHQVHSAEVAGAAAEEGGANAGRSPILK